MDVVERIIAELNKKGYSQKALAEHLKDKGVTKQTITDWKSGKSKSYYQMIADIAIFLQTTTDYLLGTAQQKAPDESGADKEREIIDMFTQCTEDERDKVRDYIQLVFAARNHKENQ